MKNSTALPLYKSHKVVGAAKIGNIKLDGEHCLIDLITPTTKYPLPMGFYTADLPYAWFLQHQPKEGGYYVEYEDGYKSYSPAVAFESGYSPLIEPTKTNIQTIASVGNCEFCPNPNITLIALGLGVLIGLLPIFIFH